jgi:ketosteroid isomerase-like protein
MTVSDDVTDIVARFGSAWAGHDLDACLAMLTDDCAFESTGPAPDGRRYQGHVAIRDAWQPIFDDASTDFTVEQTIAAGDRVVQLWRYEWADGHVRGIDVFRVSGGLISEKLSYVKG